MAKTVSPVSVACRQALDNASPPAGRRPRVAVVQDGARGHYGLALALERAGILERVYTDCYMHRGSILERVSRWAGRLGSNIARRAACRQCAELDPRKISHNPALALRLRIGRPFRPLPTDYYAWHSERLASWIWRTGLPGANAVMGFVRNIDPEFCGLCRAGGLLAVADQMIAPAEVELTEARRQEALWPGWQDVDDSKLLEAVAAYERRTWAALDHVTAPSEYVRQGLLAQGLSPEKTSVVHYPVDESSFSFVDRRSRRGPIVVGFAGAVGLRKGAPYFLDVARRFNGRQVRFVMVGQVELNPRIVASAPANVHFAGVVPRSEMAGWYEKFDLFFFPTTCEGSAYALMEAMATGLPVVTTPNSGTVARHGREGFIAGYSELDALAGYVAELARNPELRIEMGRAARQRYESFNLERYSRDLHRLFVRLLPFSGS